MKGMRCIGIVAGIVLMVLGGCAGKSQPVRFYTLAVKAQDQLPRARTGEVTKAAIGIGPVKVADYLDQARIVTRRGESRIDQAEFDQWSGSFKDNFTNVLAENVGLLLGTDRVTIFPWRSYSPVDFQVSVDVVRFDGQLDGGVVLVARWSVLGENEKKLITMKRSEIREETGGSGYEALVTAQSRALARLSREIADAILVVEQRGRKGS